MTPIKLLKIQPSDFDRCLSILNSWSESDRKQNGFGQSQPTLRSFVGDYGGYLVLSQDMDEKRSLGEESLKGFCILDRKSKDLAEILLIVVDRKFAGHGHGEQMLNAIIDDLQKQECMEIWLEVHALNTRAVALYQKMGFVITSRRAKYYPDGGDALNLKLAFNTSTC